MHYSMFNCMPNAKDTSDKITNFQDLMPNNMSKVYLG